jgi:hypothetical protein
MAKINAKISRELKETIETHPNIEQVHFDAEGNHYFQIYDFKASKLEDPKLTGKYGRIDEKMWQSNSDGTQKLIRIPDMLTRIVETIDREDVLKATITTLGSDGLDGLTPQEKEYILKLRAKSSN